MWYEISLYFLPYSLSAMPLSYPCVDSTDYAAAAAAAKSIQSCPTLCDPIDGSPPGSPIPGILQARIQEWVAIPFSNAWKWKVKGKSLSRVWLFATPWSAAYQAPPSMGFARQEYWSGVPVPSLLTAESHSTLPSHSSLPGMAHLIDQFENFFELCILRSRITGSLDPGFLSQTIATLD